MENNEVEQVAASKFNEDDLLATARARYKEARQHASAWREEARRCFDFRAGNQWSEDDKNELIAQLRMPTTFNRIDPYCRAVAGLEAGNRQQVRYIPREEGDVGVNEMYTETVRWIRDESDAEFEEADSFLDAFVSGIGATETYMDYDKDPEGMVCIDHLDCLTEVVWDAAAKKRNLTDRKYDFRIKHDLEFDEIKSMFPDKADSIAVEGGGSGWEDAEEDVEPWNRNPETSYEKGRDDQGSKKRKYSLIDYQWCEREPYYKVADPMSGQVVEMESEKYEKLAPKLRKIGVQLQAAKLRRVVWYRAFIVGSTIMEVGPAPCKTSSTRKFITAYRDRNRRMWYGIVRAMIDPQEWANKFFSQILHIINSNSKGGLLAETDAFVNPRKAEQDWANPNSVVLLKQGGLEKVRERQPATFPASIDRMMQFSIQSLGDVTGLPMELIGMVDRDQAGVLEAERKRTGITMLATLFDSLKHYHKDQGGLLLYFVQEYLSDGRLVRINGKNGQKYVKLMRQSDTIKFDVIVDEMPQSPNNKERVWGTMQVMLPILMQAGMPPEMMAEVVAYSPLPESFSQKLKQLLSSKGQVDQQMQQAIQQLQQQLQGAQQQLQQVSADTQFKEQEMQAKAEELRLKAGELQIKGMDAQTRQFDAETARMAAEVDAQAKMQQASMSVDAPMEPNGPPPMSDAEKMDRDAALKILLEDKRAASARELKLLDHRAAAASKNTDPLLEPDDNFEMKAPNAAVEGIAALAEKMDDVKDAITSVMGVVSAPRVTELIRDADGRPAGSVSIPQVQTVTEIQIEGGE